MKWALFKATLWHLIDASEPRRTTCGKVFGHGPRMLQQTMPEDLGRVCWTCRTARKQSDELEAGYLANAEFSQKIHEEWAAADAPIHDPS